MYIFLFNHSEIVSYKTFAQYNLSPEPDVIYTTGH